MPTGSTQSRLRTLHSVLAGATILAVFLIVPSRRGAEPASPALILPGPRPAAEWRTTDGSHGTHRSELADINPSTVRALEVAWVYRTGDFSKNEDGRAGTAFQATPLMVGGTLYFPTPYGRVVALDAETGVERWVFDTGVDRSDRAHKMVTSRGVAVWADPTRDSTAECAVRVLYAPYDARLFALDARSGAPCADFGSAGVVDLRAGVPRIEGQGHSYKVTSPPTVVRGVVAVGSTVYDNLRADAPSGVVRGYDARSGTLRWSWEPLEGVGARDAQGSWVPAGAANTWATMTGDEERDLLFVATSSPSPDHYGGLRPGDNRYANSVVALRGSTGEVVWHFQTVHHDLWDYDLPAPPALVTVERDGVNVPAVVQGTKLGYLFVLHRETGEPLFPVEERPVPQSDVPGEQTSPTQPVPLLPRPLSRQGLAPEDAWGITPLDRAMCRKRVEGLRHDGVFAPPSVRGTVTMPGFLGGLQWGGSGWDPGQGLLVVNVNHLATVATLVPSAELERERTRSADGKSMFGAQERTPYGVRRDALLSPLGIPCSPPPWGTLVAVDLGSGEVRWEVPLGSLRDLTRVPTPEAWGSPNLGGPLVTGGLVFIGATMDRMFRAFELETGRVVWADELPASAQAAPMTYRTRPGGPQMLVIAAGGHSQMRTALGDYLVAYHLGGTTVATEGGPR